jgi:hypothetical protein
MKTANTIYYFNGDFWCYAYEYDEEMQELLGNKYEAIDIPPGTPEERVVDYLLDNNLV